MASGLCVYCGSNPGLDPAFATAAREFAQLIALSGRTLVFGGGRVGLMGVLADAALAAGGRVIGVIPAKLAEKELAHSGLSELHCVGSMHERKALMAQLSDAFVALPGGLGTLDELFEAWTWSQLGFQRKPIGLLNVKGFFDPLVEFVRHSAASGFVNQEALDLVAVDDDAERLIERLDAMRA